MSRILGVDPGLQNFGYAIIEFEPELKLVCAGEILTKKEDKQRLVKIYEALCDVIKVYDPDFCIIERTFVNSKNMFSSLNLGQARGVVLLSFQMFSKPYKEITPTQIKKKVCGSSVAKKVDVQNYVNGLFGVKLGHNAADAVIIALCYEKEL